MNEVHGHSHPATDGTSGLGRPCFVMLAIAAILPLLGGPTGSPDAPPLFLYEWGVSGELPGQLDSPRNLVVDRLHDRVYVANQVNHSIDVFDKEGDFVQRWGGPGQGNGDGEFNQPMGVAIGPGREIYVADRGNHRIQVFDAEGTFLRKWGSQGASEGQFAQPPGLAVDSDGTVYVADKSNDRLQVFDEDGNFLRMWGYGVDDGSDAFQICTSSCQAGIGGGQDGAFQNPRDVTLGDRVYVSDTNNNRFQIFEKDGTFVAAVGSGGSGDGEFLQPEGIELLWTRLYVADRGNERIQLFDSDGNFLTSWGTKGTAEGEFEGPTGVSIDVDGKIFVVDTNRERVLVFGPGLLYFISGLDAAVRPSAPGGRLVRGATPATYSASFSPSSAR